MYPQKQNKNGYDKIQILVSWNTVQNLKLISSIVFDLSVENHGKHQYFANFFMRKTTKNNSSTWHWLIESLVSSCKVWVPFCLSLLFIPHQPGSSPSNSCIMGCLFEIQVRWNETSQFCDLFQQSANFNQLYPTSRPNISKTAALRAKM